MAIETGAVQAPSFVPVDQSTLDKQNIIITKGDWLFHFSWSLIPIGLTKCSDAPDQLAIFIKFRLGWPTIPMNLTT